jgi:hypothetical protein
MKTPKTVFAPVALLALAAAAPAVFADYPTPPEVQALYERTCKEWSAQSWIAPDGRAAFYENCLKDIPKAIPSGYEPDE